MVQPSQAQGYETGAADVLTETDVAVDVVV